MSFTHQGGLTISAKLESLRKILLIFYSHKVLEVAKLGEFN